MGETNSPFRKTLEAALYGALSHLEELKSSPVSTTASVHELRCRLGKPLANEGVPAEQVVAELVENVRGGILGSAGGRFFGWVIGGSLPAAVAADWLTSAWDQNAGLYACGPAAAVVEEIVGYWLKDVFGLPADASFALVTGCQAAHTTCLAAARYALLAQRDWDVEKQGLYSAPRIRILTSSAKHGSFERAVRLLGLGQSQIVGLSADAQDRLEAGALEQALDADSSAPTIVLLQAGDINIGACDPFEKLIPIAKRHRAWVHIDGAFGLWAAASSVYRHVVAGVAAADSWATDGHKWLNVPYDCGYAFIRDAEAHRAAMSYRAAYLTHDAEARDEMDWNPEWSRRARGFPTYAALRELGRDGIAALVERCVNTLILSKSSLAICPAPKSCGSRRSIRGLSGFSIRSQAHRKKITIGGPMKSLPQPLPRARRFSPVRRGAHDVLCGSACAIGRLLTKTSIAL
jgi:glutamate/tyrosine decarboxylase-like PLP-dependent enzyme